MGENGAGKSTLLKIINGNYCKDSGMILCDGKEVDIHSPLDTRRQGISIVFQELNQVPTISVAENLLMGRLPRKGRFVNWKETYRLGAEALKKIGYDLDPRTPLRKLSVAQRQMVEIAKAISFPNTKLILMDEPTATLTNRECQELFKVIRELKANGIAVIYISHKLEEIFEICEWVTILRDGRIIDSQPIDVYKRQSNERYSDTAIFITDHLSHIIRRRADLRDQRVLDSIFQIAQSRFAIMDGGGYIATVGKFIDERGLLFSNASYLPWRMR